MDFSNSNHNLQSATPKVNLKPHPDPDPNAIVSAMNDDAIDLKRTGHRVSNEYATPIKDEDAATKPEAIAQSESQKLKKEYLKPIKQESDSKLLETGIDENLNLDTEDESNCGHREMERFTKVQIPPLAFQGTSNTDTSLKTWKGVSTPSTHDLNTLKQRYPWTPAEFIILGMTHGLDLTAKFAHEALPHRTKGALEGAGRRYLEETVVLPPCADVSRITASIALLRHLSQQSRHTRMFGREDRDSGRANYDENWSTGSVGLDSDRSCVDGSTSRKVGDERFGKKAAPGSKPWHHSELFILGMAYALGLDRKILAQHFPGRQPGMLFTKIQYCTKISHQDIGQTHGKRLIVELEQIRARLLGAHGSNMKSTLQRPQSAELVQKTTEKCGFKFEDENMDDDEEWYGENDIKIKKRPEETSDTALLFANVPPLPMPEAKNRQSVPPNNLEPDDKDTPKCIKEEDTEAEIFNMVKRQRMGNKRKRN